MRRTRAGRQRDRKEGEQDWQQEDVWPKPCGSHLTRQGVKQGMGRRAVETITKSDLPGEIPNFSFCPAALCSFRSATP